MTQALGFLDFGRVVCECLAEGVTMEHRFLAGMAGVCLIVFAGTQCTADEPTAEPTAMPALVARLVATSGTTNVVPIRDTILKTGPAALPALRAALRQTNGVSFEALGLVRALATELCGQKQGVVARGAAKEPSAMGLTDGDVVVREDDRNVRSYDEMNLSRTLTEDEFRSDHSTHGDTNESWRLLVKRPDGSDADVKIVFDKEVAPRGVCPGCGGTIITLDRTFPLRFLTFPDSVHAYRTRGSLGPWDRLVVEALWKGDMGQYGRTSELMEEAFARECRDPLAFAVWLEALSNSGGFETVPFICDSYEKQLARTADSEALLLGRIAFVKSRCQFLVGQTAIALKIVDESIAKARSSGITNSLGTLVGWRMTLGMADDPVRCMQYARTHAQELRQYLNPRSADAEMVVRKAVQRCLAIDCPSLGRELLGLLDLESSSKFAADLDAQQKLAEQYSNELARTYWVPMKVSIGLCTQEAPPGHYQMYSVPDVTVRGPFRLDWTMYLPKILPAGHRNWAATTRLIVAGEKNEFSVGLDHDGRLRVSLRHDDELLHATVGSPKQRHRFSLEVMPHALRVEVDGQPQLVRYFADVVDPMVATNDTFAQEFAGFGDMVDNSKSRMLPRFQTVGCVGTVGEIVACVPSATKVDTEAMTATLIAMERAIKENNALTVTQAWNALQIAFRPVAGENPLYKDMERRMSALSATTEQPWVPLEQAAHGDFGVSFGYYSGEWKHDGNWFTVSDTNSEAGGGTLYATMRTESMELAGVIDIPPQASNATCFVHWNSLWKKDDNAFHIVPGAGRFDFGVWQDPKLFARNRQFEKTGGPIPFCIRSRGSDAALFIGKGDKPAATASGLKNQGDTVMINFRNFRGIPCRIGYLRTRTISVNKPLDAPAEMPELPDEKKAK